jgi:hypothetical protein
MVEKNFDPFSHLDPIDKDRLERLIVEIIDVECTGELVLYYIMQRTKGHFNPDMIRQMISKERHLRATE